MWGEDASKRRRGNSRHVNWNKPACCLREGTVTAFGLEVMIFTFIWHFSSHGFFWRLFVYYALFCNAQKKVDSKAHRGVGKVASVNPSRLVWLLRTQNEAHAHKHAEHLCKSERQRITARAAWMPSHCTLCHIHTFQRFRRSSQKYYWLVAVLWVQSAREHRFSIIMLYKHNIFTNISVHSFCFLFAYIVFPTKLHLKGIHQNDGTVINIISSI